MGLFTVLLLLIALMVALAPNFTHIDNLLRLAHTISINAILAAGMTFVILTRGIDFSVGSIVAMSGIISISFAITGEPAITSILVGVLAGALCGLVNGFLSGYFGLASFLITLGMMTFLNGLGLTMTGGRPIIAHDLSFRDLVNGYLWGVPIPVYFMIGIYGGGWFLLERTNYGRHIYTVGKDPQAAQIAGIKVKTIITSVYIIAGSCAGLVGVIYASAISAASPTIGQGYELKAVVAVVIGGASLTGGRGRLIGTLIGAIILGILNNGMIVMGFHAPFQTLINGIVILIAVIINGLKNQPALFKEFFLLFLRIINKLRLRQARNESHCASV